MVVEHFSNIRKQLDEKQESLLAKIASAQLLAYKGEKKILESELAKITQFELASQGIKLLGETEVVKFVVDVPKALPIPQFNQSVIKLNCDKSISTLISKAAMNVVTQPKLYFGDGAQGDLVVEQNTVLEKNFNTYCNVTIKEGGTLTLSPNTTYILLVSGTFILEQGGYVKSTGHTYSTTFYLAAKTLEIHGTIQSTGAHNAHNNYSYPGSNIIVASNHVDITGSISSSGGTYTPKNTNNYYYDQIQYSPVTIIGYPPGTISVQFETGEVKGQFNPALSPATQRFNRETKGLQKC